jgi:DNA-binding transcriptional ArsR family regulator
MDANLDKTLAALADPTRRAILTRLADGEALVSELAEPFVISQPAISRHIKVLLNAGLIIQRVDGTKRPCRLAPGALPELDDYLNMLRTALEQNYDRLDRLLAASAAPPPKATGALPVALDPGKVIAAQERQTTK